MFFFFQAEDGIRDVAVTGVQTCALPIYREERAQLVRADRLQRDLEDFAEQHGYGLVVVWGRCGVVAGCCCRPGRPPPVTLRMRCCMSRCALSSDALGSTSTVSCSVRPLTTSM